MGTGSDRPTSVGLNAGARVLFFVLVCTLITAVSPAAGSTSRFGGEGEAAGLMRGAYGVALNPSSGGVYVTDGLNHRVDAFDPSGHFLFAWGWGVDEANPVSQPQTCTESCQEGQEGAGVGEFDSSLYAIASDGNPLSPSFGDVYVADFSQFRVQKFDSAGKFLLTFGKEVNQTTHDDVCIAGEDCGAGAEGSADGQFEWAFHAQNIAVGPAGDIYVGDKARIEIFEPTGTWLRSVSLAGLSGTGQVTALAVDSSGDMFVKDSEAPGVHEFEPTGGEASTQFDAGSASVEALAPDPATGDLLVSDGGGGAHVLRYDPAGAETASFGSKTAGTMSGLAFSDALNELYVSDPEFQNTSVWILAPPEPGPSIEENSETASAEAQGLATLEASVNPEGQETTYSFEYVDETDFQTSQYALATKTPPATISGSQEELFEDHQAVASLSGLIPGETYHYRLVATNSKGTATGTDRTVTEVPAALVEGPWVSDVASTSATLAARIDPLGLHTDFQLEYGTDTSYGATLSGSVGEGTGYVSVSFHQQGLQPGTLYHYRLITVNAAGTVNGSDRTFTTAPVREESALPDGRGWELVSPPDKQGAAIERFELGQIQAATGGGGITFVASKPIGEIPPGENQSGKTGHVQILSTRGAEGWHSEDIAIPYTLPQEEVSANLLDFNPEYQIFSPDLSLAAIEPHELEKFSLSPLAPQRVDYLRENKGHTYVPLVDEANVEAGVEYGGKHIPGLNTFMHFVGASADLSHVLLSSPEALTPDAPAPECETSSECKHPNHLFEWVAGQLHLVSILPDGKTALEEIEAAASTTSLLPAISRSPISEDGRRIVWRTGGRLYVRDMVEEETKHIGGRETRFQAMSNDGKRIFFLEAGDLYVFDSENGTRTDLTAGHAVRINGAGVQETVLGVSKDGTYVYFIASGALTGAATDGQDNLYEAHLSEGSWTISLVATISGEDEKDWFQQRTENSNTPVQLQYVSSRVSQDGRYLSFMSNRSLTGYDNVDARSGQPDEEVYEYDAVASRLTCVSCEPSGARPTGVLDRQPTNENLFSPGELFVDRPGVWTRKGAGVDHWLAGSTPAWRETGETVLYQPHYLTDDGRMFFESPDALVSKDTNGLEDVYEFEPAGVGGCSTSSSTFSPQTSGCVGLISSGTANSESALFDASANGDDAFFVTSARLKNTDYDENDDVYDAHVCSAAVPCAKTVVLPPPCTSGDSCKPPPSPQPEIFGPAPSATFSGNGNVTEPPPKHQVRHKPLTRQQKRARAMAACRKRKSGHMRVLCERRVSRRYRVRTTAVSRHGRRGGK